MDINKTIAIQGLITSFHDVVAGNFFGENTFRKECFSFKELCASVATGESDYGVMAIENALAGTLLTNHKLIDEFGLRIIGETYLKIDLHLASNEEDIEHVSTVYSHPVALSQCTDFFHRHPTLTPIEKFDTAGSAHEIALNELKRTGAICSRQSAEKWGLNILEENVEDHHQNCTRFVVLSKERTVEDFNKASVAFSVANEPGALVNVLTPINERGINMTTIQSVPVEGKLCEYSIHVDLECNPSDFKWLKQQWNTYSYRVIGTYIKGKKPIFN